MAVGQITRGASGVSPSLRLKAQEPGSLKSEEWEDVPVEASKFTISVLFISSCLDGLVGAHLPSLVGEGDLLCSVYGLRCQFFQQHRHRHTRKCFTKHDLDQSGLRKKI